MGRHFALTAVVAVVAMGSATAFAPTTPLALRTSNKMGGVSASPAVRLAPAAPRLRSAPSIIGTSMAGGMQAAGANDISQMR